MKEVSIMTSESMAREVETRPGELQVDELDDVCGGIIAVLIGLLLPAVQTPSASIEPRA
jgi:hypothetical protein